MNCHEAIDVMGDAVEGRLQLALRAGFEEHIAECGSCGTYYEQLRITRLALELLPPGQGTSPRRELLLNEFREKLAKRPR